MSSTVITAEAAKSTNLMKTYARFNLLCDPNGILYTTAMAIDGDYSDDRNAALLAKTAVVTFNVITFGKATASRAIEYTFDEGGTTVAAVRSGSQADGKTAANLGAGINTRSVIYALDTNGTSFNILKSGGIVDANIPAAESALNTRSSLYADDGTQAAALKTVAGTSNALRVANVFYDDFSASYAMGNVSSPFVSFSAGGVSFYGIDTNSAGYKHSYSNGVLARNSHDSESYLTTNTALTLVGGSTTIAAAPAANTRRTGIIVANLSANAVYVDLLGGTASATNGIWVSQFAYLHLDEKMTPQGAITAFTSATGPSNVHVYEGFVTEV